MMNNPSSPSISPSTVTTAAIIDRLNQATTDLLWPSESDCPFEIVTWAPGIEMTAAALFGNPDDPGLTIELIDLANLFAPVITIEDWYEAAELAQVDRYKALLQTIESNLSQVQIFRIGTVEVTIYIIGKTPAGDIIGLKTQSIET